MKEVGNNFQESVLSLLVGSDDSTQCLGFSGKCFYQVSDHLTSVAPIKKPKRQTEKNQLYKYTYQH